MAFVLYGMVQHGGTYEAPIREETDDHLRQACRSHRLGGFADRARSGMQSTARPLAPCVDPAQELCNAEVRQDPGVARPALAREREG